jgi:hypothetical protein
MAKHTYKPGALVEVFGVVQPQDGYEHFIKVRIGDDLVGLIDSSFVRPRSHPEDQASLLRVVQAGTTFAREWSIAREQEYEHFIKVRIGDDLVGLIDSSFVRPRHLCHAGKRISVVNAYDALVEAIEALPPHLVARLSEGE